MAAVGSIQRTKICAEVRSIPVVADPLFLSDKSHLNLGNRGLTGPFAQKIHSRCLEIVIDISDEGHLLIVECGAL
jgi:hypothetical protein